MLGFIGWILGLLYYIIIGDINYVEYIVCVVGLVVLVGNMREIEIVRE